MDMCESQGAARSARSERHATGFLLHQESKYGKRFTTLNQRPMGCGMNEVLGHGGVVPLPFRHPQPTFRHRSRRNLSDQPVIRVNLLKYGNRAGGAWAVDGSRYGVIVHGVIGAAQIVEGLHL